MRVLIVDDCAEDREAVVRFLNRMGVDAKCVSTLQDATRADSSADFDLILLDVQLEDCCSVQVTKYFAETCKTPVVIWTGSPESFHSTDQLEQSIITIDKEDFAGPLQETLTRLAAKVGR